jgi:nucleotide-binding universal stress UspA family protein
MGAAPREHRIGGPKERIMARIVVGVDGSDHSKQALRWALDEARMRDASLRVVYAWTLPVYARYSVAAAPVLAPSELRRAAQERVAKAVEDVAGRSTDGHIESRAVEGPAASVLVEEAEGADLLVVGSRGRGGFTGLLLGSVGQQCTHHAGCPVVIVRR